MFSIYTEVPLLIEAIRYAIQTGDIMHERHHLGRMETLYEYISDLIGRCPFVPLFIYIPDGI